MKKEELKLSDEEVKFTREEVLSRVLSSRMKNYRHDNEHDNLHLRLKKRR
jgi:hypothetical protein